MSVSAQRAQLDFVRLAAEEPSSLYFEQFLRDGFAAWPSIYRRRFPGLATWPGVAGLKQSLRTLAEAPDDWNVLLASRSLSLMKLGARCMFRVCRNVLTTDLSWPAYQQVIEKHAQRRGAPVTVVPLRNRILHEQWTANDVAHYLAAAFANTDCDGLFLPAVDHLGVRLPIREIVWQIKRRRELRFCFIDAAQAFCQLPIRECFDVADFVVAGSHKWMGAYLPAGIAFIRPMRHAPDVCGDALTRFTEQLNRGNLDSRSETVNLTPLFACAGAAADCGKRCHRDVAIPSIQEVQRMIALPSADWHPVTPSPAMRSRITLFDAHDPDTRQQPPEAIRRRWLDSGCIVTAYAGGRVRVAVSPQDVAERVTRPRVEGSRFTWTGCR